MENKDRAWTKWLFWFSLAIAVVGVYKVLDNFDNIANTIKGFFGIISPFLAGILIAYILYVPCKKIEETYKRVKKCKFVNKRARTLSIITVYIIVLILFVILINVILPPVIQSVVDLANNFGHYYNVAIEKINALPEDSVLKIKAKLSQLYNVIGQASILTTDKEKNIVSLSTNGDLLIVKSVSNEKGKAEMKMNIEKNNNEDITIAFSAKYMMEALNALNTDIIEMSFIGEVKPITIKNTTEDGLIQLVVPSRTY